MLDKFSEQMQQSFKPASELLAVNAKAMEKLAQKQTAFMTSVMSDSVAYTRNLTSQKDLNGFLKVQKTYADDLQEKLTSCARDSYAVMNEAQEQVGELFKDMFSQAQGKAEEIVTKTAKAASDSVK